jgi:hypothetical protein
MAPSAFTDAFPLLMEEDGGWVVWIRRNAAQQSLEAS